MPESSSNLTKPWKFSTACSKAGSDFTSAVIAGGYDRHRRQGPRNPSNLAETWELAGRARSPVAGCSIMAGGAFRSA